MSAGFSVELSFRFLLSFLSLSLPLSLARSIALDLCLSALPLATLPIFLSSISFLAIFGYARSLANHFLLCNPASTRSALGLLSLFCSSASALLVLFCFFRFVQSSSPARESLAATRLPLEAAIQKKKNTFLPCSMSRTTNVQHRHYNFFQRHRQLFHTFFFTKSEKYSSVDQTSSKVLDHSKAVTIFTAIRGNIKTRL